MTFTEIIQYGSEPSPTTLDDTIKAAVTGLKRVKTPQHFVLGTKIQDSGAVQITAEWDGIYNHKNPAETPELSGFIGSMHSSLGEPQSILHADLKRSVFGPDSIATANVVEYIQTYFAASCVTPEFQKKIEDDFVRFDEIFLEGVKGHVGWTMGWVLEEQEHEGIKGEKARCTLVVRGWESMDAFEEAVKMDGYKKATPILFGWGAKFKMWHVGRKVVDGLKVTT